jgi:fatty acid desaturase
MATHQAFFDARAAGRALRAKNAAPPPTEAARITRQTCAADIARARAWVREAKLEDAFAALHEKSLLRYVAAAATSWAVLIGAVFAAWTLHWTLAAPALFIVANRQRAIGNLIHDFSHGGFGGRGDLADRIGAVLVALPMFATFANYRRVHLAHHLYLGSATHDPEFIQDAAKQGATPLETLKRYVFDGNAWLGSIHGLFLSDGAVGKAKIIVWWAATLGLLALFVSPGFAIFFAAMWMVSRASVYHVVTMFRELSDHVGLPIGGILSYTRSAPLSGLLKPFMHPYDNGRHVVHHLFPGIPHYNFHKAHRLLMAWPEFAAAEHCEGYFAPEGAKGRYLLQSFGRSELPPPITIAPEPQDHEHARAA